MADHAKKLATVVEAVKNLIPKKGESEKILREIKRIEQRDAAQQSETVIEEIEPSE
ncbi:unnamed protein product [marine sediment metagenome]|uniref:Uncharacterized protein n=1 Tax=marine sediment metagenome TaxID=412755 RepID=X1SAU6_9ZZZZ